MTINNNENEINRDELALRCLTGGILSNYAIGQQSYESLAKHAYAMADAMIEARKEHK